MKNQITFRKRNKRQLGHRILSYNSRTWFPKIYTTYFPSPWQKEKSAKTQAFLKKMGMFPFPQHLMNMNAMLHPWKGRPRIFSSPLLPLIPLVPLTMLPLVTSDASAQEAQKLAGISQFQVIEPLKAHREQDIYQKETSPVIIRSGHYIKRENQFLVEDNLTRKEDEIWIEIMGEWIEGVSCINKPNEIKLTEVWGDVKLTIPGQNQPIQAKNDMIVPSGTKFVLGKGKSQVAADIGNSHSVRFMPHSEATISRTLTPKSDKVSVDLKKGAAFSKVKQKGSTVDFRIVTPQGVAAARGTDYATIVLPNKTDVWVAKGTVEMLTPDGSSADKVSTKSPENIKVLRYPPEKNSTEHLKANLHSFTLATELIPQFNCKAMEIRQKLSEGKTITREEASFLLSIKKLRYFVKVKRVQ